MLRPLRTLSHMPELHTIVETIIQSGAGLLPVFGLFGLIFFVWGILGQQLFASSMNRQCFAYNTTDMSLILDPFRRLEPTLCGGNQVCPSGELCVITQQSPNYGVTNFNNIASSFLTLFVALTMEGWVDVMYFIEVLYM